MIGIILEREIELEIILKFLENKEEETKLGIPYYMGSLQGTDVVVCQCGVGKVEAAIYTQKMIESYEPKAIIHSGYAIGLSQEVKPLDMVIGSSYAYHDMQQFVIDMFTTLETKYEADGKLLQLAKKMSDATGVHTGLILTGDQFNGELVKKGEVRFLEEALCVDMECCAVAHTAFLNDIPFLAVKVIYGERDKEMCEKATSRSLQVIMPMLRYI